MKALKAVQLIEILPDNFMKLLHRANSNFFIHFSLPCFCSSNEVD